MKASRLLSAYLVLGAVTTFSGCLVPRSQLVQTQTQNRALAEQCRAQLAEIENLKIHSRSASNHLLRTEEELALLQDELGLDRTQMADFRRQRDRLHNNFISLLGGGASMSPEMQSRLAEISRRYPALRFDPATGISKLDTDILFDTGKAELKPGADKLLGELTRVLKAPEADELKVLVVGHTDDR